MDSNAIIEAQRSLRQRIDDHRKYDALTGASDLAAHLLLYLDDARHCWQLTLQWLRQRVDADRVDGGFTRQYGADAVYQPEVEALRGDLPIVSSVGVAIDASAPAVRAVLDSRQPVLYGSITEDRRFSDPLRQQLLALDTKAKLAVALHDDRGAIALICCDWTKERKRWQATQCEQIGHFANDVLSPIFNTARQLDESSIALVAPAPVRLTAAELRVARLVVQGLSYKEIARQLDRSFSTVDHSLRSIRDKLGARSTARMMGMLGELLRKHYS
ncbi:helix-turn-helix transcriptional regulator [Herbaspirillum camelliae]|uniref:helix-turn-helix transcriptional regulator n=1 Tax=Herbaspirillum camelliae TaxID=1892903 RepID=UPI00094A1645|nr:LuxR C-terminal-related transcriptional regulator [Herbaspirillum camelliae]